MSKSISKPEDLEPGVASRRRFLTQAGMTTLGVLGASKLGAMAAPAMGELTEPAAAVGQASTNDVNILNFALNLEYLEAEFYLRAAFGHGLDSSDVTGTGTPGDVTGGSAVPFQTPAFRDYAEEVARDEQAHVKFLRSALGSKAVARPAIDLAQSFTTAAIAAGVIGTGQQFDPFADEQSFLLGAFIFEDVGVTAYHGAAPLIQDKGILAAAAGILAVEAYHAGLIRTVLFSLGLFKPARLISNLRDAADGTAAQEDQPIRVQGHSNIVPADANGLAFSRTAQQVLGIVYLGGASANYGFFPNRLNGAIR
ncbi:MAG: ferritin-like domain-containing protein [Acidobacteriota bacterium]|nr:ferritin-like domain-containing protein [Acidobacteriota bacterium]